MSNLDEIVLRGSRIVVSQSSQKKKNLKLAHENHQGIVKTKESLRTRWPGMDDATETMEKNCQGCVVNQPLDKYTSLQPTPSPLGPWVKGAVDLVVQSMENPFWLISIIIRPIQKHTFHKTSLHVNSS